MPKSLSILLLSLPLLALAHGGSHAENPLLRRAARASSSSTAAAITTAPKSSTRSASAAVGASTTSSAGSAVFTPAVTLYPPGTIPPVTGAPGLPDLTLVKDTSYPALDITPPTNSTLVQSWLSRIDMTNPALRIPVNGLNDCTNATNAAAVANSTSTGTCWWTCGGHCTRDSDITFCPNKGTWGVSYDDGPSPDTPRLLAALTENGLKATFFVVGSRVISRPEMLQAAYMMGHQVSVHTWAHPALTTMTNAQIIAELAWSMEVIKAVTGVTPNTMRPPYGDIEYICAQMGLAPIIWTTDGAVTYDTQDWQIGTGLVTTAQVMTNFEDILGNASTLSTGFIVLEHDLYTAAVNLAINEVIPLALNTTPKLTLKPIITCLGSANNQAYQETFIATQPGTNGTLEDATSPNAGINGSTVGNTTTTANTTTTSTTGKTGAGGRVGVALVMMGLMVVGSLVILV